MYLNQSPKWLNTLERRLGWIAVPNLAAFLIGCQIIGFLLILFDPRWWTMLLLDPGAVLRGEIWRLVTFIALPLSLSPMWMVFVLWFLYFIVESLENAWGSFRTTFYVLVSILLTIGFSFAFVVPITSVAGLQSTLFLAAAALAPDSEILLFMFLPVKIVWLALITAAFILWQLLTGTWLERIYLVVIYANFLLFFGPHYYQRLKQLRRRQQFKRNFR
jgi:hypothetical protein